MAKATQNTNISGRNIYLDNHNQTVYYDKITKKGYIIDNKFEKQFYFYNHRFILIAVVLILFSSYFPSWIHVIILGIILGIITELLFRFQFLNKLRLAKKFDKTKKQTLLKAIVASKDVKKTILRIILYLAFAILIVLNAITMKADYSVIIISILLCLVGCYYALINTVALIKINQQK